MDYLFVVDTKTQFEFPTGKAGDGKTSISDVSDRSILFASMVRGRFGGLPGAMKYYANEALTSLYSHGFENGSYLHAEVVGDFIIFHFAEPISDAEISLLKHLGFKAENRMFQKEDDILTVKRLARMLTERRQGPVEHDIDFIDLEEVVFKERDPKGGVA